MALKWIQYKTEADYGKLSIVNHIEIVERQEKNLKYIINWSTIR